MSPTSAYACHAFNNGGCPLSQDQCLYAHLSTRTQSQSIRTRHPQTHPRDAAIAEAAAKAGFDCSDWRKFQGFITADMDSLRRVHYPDKYTGAAAFQSSLYPDRWSPNGSVLRKGGVNVRQDAERAVPAFAKTTFKVLKDLGQQTRRCRESSTPTVVGDFCNRAATGTNRQPLGPRSGNEKTTPAFHDTPHSTGRPFTNKRTADEYIDLAFSSLKRAKIEESTERRHRKENELPVIDFRVASPGYFRTPTSQTLVGSKNHAPEQTRPDDETSRPWRGSVRQSVIRDDTTSILARCASKLRGASYRIGMDRDALRERWEIDAGLQLQHVTDDLADLNARFTEAEQVISSAINIVEEKLLQR